MIRCALALILALAVLGPALAGAQPAACKRWRGVFAAMPERPVRVERQAGGFQCATREEIAARLVAGP